MIIISVHHIEGDAIQTWSWGDENGTLESIEAFRQMLGQEHAYTLADRELVEDAADGLLLEIEYTP